MNELRRSSIRIISTLCACMCVTGALTGCTGVNLPGWPEPPAVIQMPEEDGQITSLGLTPDLEYEKPVIEAHIEVDQLGYLPDSPKIAVFRGDDLNGRFSVVDQESGDIAYSGEIRSKTESTSGETFFYGDFTELAKEGTYYVQTDIIGRSYSFEIKKDLYSEVLANSLKQFYLNRCGSSLTEKYAHDGARSACHTDVVALQSDASVKLDVTGGWHMNPAGDRDVIKGCNTVEALLLAYEYNTEIFGDDGDIPEGGNGIPDIFDEIRIETDWLLKMQEQSTGAVYEKVSSVDQGKGFDNPCHIENIDMNATLSFASALGYFSYLYQTYDSVYATVCLQAADRAMKYAAKFPENLDEDKYFRAAAMLYRATGYYNYRMIVENYCAGRNEYNMADNVVFTGAVTYLATKQKTSPDICSTMMGNLRKYAENMAYERRDALYLMGEKSKTVENSALLSEIARLTVANYIISSNEYENVMERYLHYFLGCNPYNTCYVGQYGNLNVTDTDASRDIMRQPEQDAYFVLLVSGVMKK